MSGRYGYHRDELYFLAAGHHLAWGYPDQPPLTPLLARVMSDVSATSLVVLRLPSALAAMLLVVMTGLSARELGGDRAQQTMASGVMAVSGLLLGACHLLSTTDYDLVAWAVLIWLVLRILRTGRDWLWLAAGVVAGLGLFDSDLVAFLAASLAVGVLICGPRSVFASPWVYLAALVAGLMWTPYLVWQAQHGWPELAVAHSIAAGNSGTSAPRSQILPQQFLLIGPTLSPILVAGLVSLVRRPSYRWCRAISVAWFVLFVLVTVMGGKPYYLGGMFPVLVAAGSIATLDWVRRHPPRRRWVVAAFVTALPVFVVTLPVVPLSVLHDTPVVAMNYDAGETVGWPTMTRQIAGVYLAIPPGERARTAILASNYGEAGAVDRYGKQLGLPSAFSGHMSFYLWGPPPASVNQVVAVGFDAATLHSLFDSVRPAGQLNNGHDIDDDEQGSQLFIASGLRTSWPATWPDLKDYG